MRFFQKQFNLLLTAWALTTCFEPSILLAFSNADQPRVGISDNGTLISLWSAYDDLNASYVIVTCTWDSVNGWSECTTLSAIPGISFNPILLVKGTDNAAVVWTSLDTNYRPTLHGIIRNNGTWEPAPTQLSIPGESVLSYRIDLDSSGAIYVIWSACAENSTNSVIYALTGSSITGGWNTVSGITQISD